MGKRPLEVYGYVIIWYTCVTLSEGCGIKSSHNLYSPYCETAAAATMADYE